LLPTTACLLQHRLGLPTTCAALDFNLGCSGYIYGLALAQALISSGQARRVLLLTGDTYTKLLDPSDKSTRTIFGDAGTATLLDAACRHRLDSFVLGTDGRGEKELIVAAGGARNPVAAGAVAGSPDPACLFMNGPEIFNFTLKAVPKLVSQVLAKASLAINDIDLFVFHQANAYMLEHLRRKIGIPQEKFVLHFAHCGNTVSSTIPIVLEHLIAEGRIKSGMKLLLAGFGVGFSWGACIFEWHSSASEIPS
jgi:3-oxoacyl-[acyl-carrier-protein] synthase-3